MMRKKLGLIGEKNNDEKLINNLLSLLHEQKADYTNTFCSLMNEDVQNDKTFNNKEFIYWHQKWKERLAKNTKSTKESLKLMRSVNPIVIPRNHKVEEVLEAANKDDQLYNQTKFLNFFHLQLQSHIEMYQHEYD